MGFHSMQRWRDASIKVYDMTPGKRLRHARERRGLSQTEVGSLCGWSLETARARISNYERDKRAISADVAKVLAKILSVTPSWLLFGKEECYQLNPPAEHAVRENHPADYWQLASLNTELTPIERVREIHNRLQYVLDISHHVFALEVDGDSMSAPLGAEHTFPRKTQILVDPDRHYQHGDFVVVRDKHAQQFFLRQYQNDSSQPFLRALNPAYPPIHFSDNIEICGTVCAAFQWF